MGCWDLLPGVVEVAGVQGLPRPSFLKVWGRPRLNPGATGSGSLLQQDPYSEGESGKRLLGDLKVKQPYCIKLML